MTRLSDTLRDLGACSEAIAWAATQPDDFDLDVAWATCQRGDWMAWVLRRARVSGHAQHVRVAVGAARLVVTGNAAPPKTPPKTTPTSMSEAPRTAPRDPVPRTAPSMPRTAPPHAEPHRIVPYTGLVPRTAPPVPPDVLAGTSLALDMVYAAQPTAFMRAARAAGCPRTEDGLGMLVGQAAESFAVWRGVHPETAPVYAALRAQLSAH